jgi:hypothetical protein
MTLRDDVSEMSRQQDERAGAAALVCYWVEQPRGVPINGLTFRTKAQGG